MLADSTDIKFPGEDEWKTKSWLQNAAASGAGCIGVLRYWCRDFADLGHCGGHQ